MPWFLVAAMILAWALGVKALLDSLATLLFLRDASLPDIEALARTIQGAQEPIGPLFEYAAVAYTRSIGEASSLAFPLAAARLVLSVLLVIASGMVMSGRPGSQRLAMQALLANAALATLTFWLMRHARYAWADTVVRTRAMMPDLATPVPPELVEWWTRMQERRFWLWLPRLWLVLFDVGALLLAALTLTSARTKAFFEAAEAASAEQDEP